jgi:hypothetical protein
LLDSNRCRQAAVDLRYALDLPLGSKTFVKALSTKFAL